MAEGNNRLSGSQDNRGAGGSNSSSNSGGVGFNSSTGNFTLEQPEVTRGFWANFGNNSNTTQQNPTQNPPTNAGRNVQDAVIVILDENGRPFPLWGNTEFYAEHINGEFFIEEHTIAAICLLLNIQQGTIRNFDFERRFGSNRLRTTLPISRERQSLNTLMNIISAPTGYSIISTEFDQSTNRHIIKIGIRHATIRITHKEQGVEKHNSINGYVVGDNIYPNDLDELIRVLFFTVVGTPTQHNDNRMTIIRIRLNDFNGPDLGFGNLTLSVIYTAMTVDEVIITMNRQLGYPNVSQNISQETTGSSMNINVEFHRETVARHNAILTYEDYDWSFMVIRLTHEEIPELKRMDDTIVSINQSRFEAIRDRVANINIAELVIDGATGAIKNPIVSNIAKGSLVLFGPNITIDTFMPRVKSQSTLNVAVQAECDWDVYSTYVWCIARRMWIPCHVLFTAKFIVSYTMIINLEKIPQDILGEFHSESHYNFSKLEESAKRLFLHESQSRTAGHLNMIEGRMQMSEGHMFILDNGKRDLVITDLEGKHVFTLSPSPRLFTPISSRFLTNISRERFGQRVINANSFSEYGNLLHGNMLRELRVIQ